MGYVSVDLASPSSYVSVQGASPSSRRSSESSDGSSARAADPASRAWSLLAFVVKSAVAVLASVASVALTIAVWQLAARSPLTRTAPSAAVPPLRPDEGTSLIEVVSSDDRTVVELRPLDEVHRQARTHRGVWVFVVNVAGQVLLLRRPTTMMTCPDTWSVVGEHNQPGESYLQAGRRGVAEELGWSLEQVAGMDVTLLGAPTFFEQRYQGAARSGAVARTDRQHSAYALLRLPASGAPPMAPARDEVSARRWVPLERLAGEVARGGAPAWSKSPLGSAPARILCLLGARLAARGSSALPGRGQITGLPATASGVRASRLQSRRFHPL